MSDENERLIGYTKEGKKIVSAQDQKVLELEPYVQEVLEALGHPEAWVTDLSSVSDFMHKIEELEEPYEHNGRRIAHRLVDADPSEVRKVAEKLGVDVDIDDYIWQVAQRLRDRS